MEKYSLLDRLEISPSHDGENGQDRQEPKLYKNRWVMLAILTLLTAENISQWLFYSAISNIVMYHYNVSSFLAQMLSLNNLAINMAFGLPATIIVNKTDLKVGCMISGGLSLAGLWIKYLGTGIGGFYITLCGQILASFGTCFVLPLPAHLASTWFGVLERSKATSIAASGLNIGMALAYLFSSQFVPHTKDHIDIQCGLEKSILVQAIICSLTIIATVLDFEIQPPSPPSHSQANVDDQPTTFRESIALLIRNKSYIFTLLAFGLVTGVLYAFFSILSDIVLSWFPGEEKKMGWMGFLGCMAGIPGMYLAGYILDKTKAFKKVLVVYTALIALTILSFTFAVMYASVVWMPFIVIGLFGFLTSGLTTTGFVLATELTYPSVPEVYSSGMLLSAGTFFGVIVLGVTSYAITADSVEFVNWFMTGICFLAFFFSPFVKAHYQRLAKDTLH